MRALGFALVLLVATVRAQGLDRADLERCAAIAADAERLACYDGLSARSAATPAQPGPAEAGGAKAAPQPAPSEQAPSLIGERWGIDDTDTRFDVRPHRPTYLLFARYSDHPNTLPTSPTKPALAEPLDIKHTEAKFQVSFKVKLADFGDALFGIPSTLWAGYTQQSQWQVYNPGVSRPFRETDYEPELMWAFFPDRRILGWRWRLAALGLNHQSNGRSEPLSRSWNRVYLMLGLEQENIGLLIRPWLRIKEDYRDDDNPDITRYLGYGDVTGVYRFEEHTLSLTGRYNPATGKGAIQLGWNFPLQRRMRGYLQWFSGYGESLIDYNVHQNTIGIGISLSDSL